MARIDYNPQNIREMTDAQIRKAYSEVRSIARKRIQRMQHSEFADTDIANKEFKPVKQLTPSELRQGLLDVSVFVRDPRSKLNYHRNIISKTLDTLQSHGYEIPADNLKQFGDFMEYVRDRWKGRKMPPSDLVASIYEKASRKGISAKTLMREFKSYLDEEESMDTLITTIDNSRPLAKYGRVTARQLRQNLGID